MATAAVKPIKKVTRLKAPVNAVAQEMGKMLDPRKRGDKTNELEKLLLNRVIGQNDAVKAITEIYQDVEAGLQEVGRPLGNFLFLGPTGSGKTHIVEMLAEVLTGNPNSVLKVDCTEFQHSHEIAKLVGSPPGYLGHRETHPMLSQEMLNHRMTPNCQMVFVLFDEIEKASDALWKILLGIMDKATLTLGDNRRVDFSRAMIFMTSNLGAAEIEKQLSGRVLGLYKGDETGAKNTEVTGMSAAKKKFSPEFMNRLDKVVVFKPLGSDEIIKIVDLELNRLQMRILNSQTVPFVIQRTEVLRDHLAKVGTSRQYGARFLRREIRRLLTNSLSNLIASGQMAGVSAVKLDWDGEQVTFEVSDPADVTYLPAQSLLEVAA